MQRGPDNQPISLPMIRPRAESLDLRGGRRCGDCQGCCVHLDIPELQKPLGVRCPHLTTRGCGIYKQRPKPCIDYRCLWLQGHFANQDRPDRSGIMLELTHTREDQEQAIVAREMWAGAADRGRGYQMMAAMVANRLDVLIVWQGKVRRIVPGCHRPPGAAIKYEYENP